MDSRVDLDCTDLDKELRCIEYPGIVKNDEKMLETLGGTGRISQAFCEQVRRMELILHPENRYCKPAFGDCVPTGGLLIKITVRVPKNGRGGGGRDTPSEPATHKVKVLGHCKKSFQFNSLCDFQFLPIVRTPATNQFQYLYDKIMPLKFPPEGWLRDVEQPLLPIPYVFARSDSVQQNTFRIHPLNSPFEDNSIGVVRNRHTEMQTLAEFSLTEPVPEKPNPIVYKNMIAKLVNDYQFAAVKKLFDECPIWNKVSLIHEANVSLDKLKVIIPALCYHFRTGPWRTMYVRFGYDPSKHFEARYYQTFDYRIRFGAKLGAHVKAKRGTNPRVCPRSAHKDSVDNLAQDQNYPYLEDGRLPRGRQSFYRYCDVRLPKVQEMLDKIPTPLSGARCNVKTGWLPANFSAEVRTIVHLSVKQAIQKFRKESGLDADVEDEEEDDFEDEEDDGEDAGDDNDEDDDDIEIDDYFSGKIEIT